MHHNNVDITNDDDNGIDDVVTRVEMETTDYSKSCYWTWDNDDYDDVGDGDDGDDHDDSGDWCSFGGFVIFLSIRLNTRCVCVSGELRYK